MRVTVFFVLIIINLTLQSTILRSVSVFGISPDTQILIIVSYAILRGDMEGAVFGFFAGLIRDMMFCTVIGEYALLGLLTGFLAGKPFRNFFRENDFLPLFLAGVLMIMHECGYYFLTYLLQGETDFFYYFHRIILPETAYSVILAIPVYRLVHFINGKVEEREKRMRKLF
ncbi:hypothetical protein FACS1894188_08290 [Clostridia bacterium]|nr:hypothetical protein FACS1894188_08290 [Clostridia bacterium]